MANPTSNFGWVMPSATDLVTDLPADFEVFGQAVDTDFVGLKGGTTGQVLAKASGTDLDFVWSADAAGMTNPMTTTADIIYSSSGSTPARLGIGSTDDVLTVAGGVPTWAAPAGGGKILQVVQGSYSTYTLIASTSYNNTGLSVSITPSSATSKIFVMVAQAALLYRNEASIGASLQLLRDATPILVPGGTSMHYNIGVGSGTQLTTANVAPIFYIDEPATTSSTTYKTQGKITTTANGAGLYCQNDDTQSYMILMEIGA
jgi:hypothetical protein